LKAEPIVEATVAVVIITMFWYLASAILKSYFLPSPLDAAPCLLGLLGEPSTWRHIASSATRVMLGLALGSVAGLAVGIASRYIRGRLPS